MGTMSEWVQKVTQYRGTIQYVRGFLDIFFRPFRNGNTICIHGFLVFARYYGAISPDFDETIKTNAFLPPKQHAE